MVTSTPPEGIRREHIEQARRRAHEEARQARMKARHRKMAVGAIDIVSTTLLCAGLIALGLHYCRVYVPLFGTWMITGGVLFVIESAVRYGVARAMRERDRDRD